MSEPTHTKRRLDTHIYIFKKTKSSYIITLGTEFTEKQKFTKTNKGRSWQSFSRSRKTQKLWYLTRNLQTEESPRNRPFLWPHQTAKLLEKRNISQRRSATRRSLPLPCLPASFGGSSSKTRAPNPHRAAKPVAGAASRRARCPPAPPHGKSRLPAQLPGEPPPLLRPFGIGGLPAGEAPEWLPSVLCFTTRFDAGSTAPADLAGFLMGSWVLFARRWVPRWRRAVGCVVRGL
jgi:hypothetical protein